MNDLSCQAFRHVTDFACIILSREQFILDHPLRHREFHTSKRWRSLPNLLRFTRIQLPFRITFSKFVSLLITQKIHFTRADKFLDTFESSIPQQDLQNARNYFAALLNQPVVDVGGISEFEKSSIREYIQHFLQMPQKDALAITEEELPKYMLRIANRFQFVNCWHMNENEPAGMWQLYMNANEGVAIQTTVAALKQSVEQSKYPIYLGAVSYIDYANESWGTYQPLSPIFHKRKSFAHEREIRAVIVNPNDVDARNTEGILIPVQLRTLISKIFISPKAEPWFKETVKSVSAQYGLNIEPIQSNLYDQPQF